MLRLEGRATEMAEEVVELRRSRLELEERITRQFNDQLRDLKRIFESDVLNLLAAIRDVLAKMGVDSAKPA